MLRGTLAAKNRVRTFKNEVLTVTFYDGKTRKYACGNAIGRFRIKNPLDSVRMV